MVRFEGVRYLLERFVEGINFLLEYFAEDTNFLFVRFAGGINFLFAEALHFPLVVDVVKEFNYLLVVNFERELHFLLDHYQLELSFLKANLGVAIPFTMEVY